MIPTGNSRAPAATATSKGHRSRSGNQPKTFRGRTRPNLPLSSKYKTELCHYLAEQGRCPFGDQCTYAHSQSELRYIERHPKHKTLPCRDFSTVGFCPFGERCSFIHYKRDPEEILKNAYAQCQQKDSAAEMISNSVMSWKSPSVILTEMSGSNQEEISANDKHSTGIPGWSSPWSDVEMHCSNPSSGPEINTQGFLQVPGSAPWQRSMQSSPHSSAGIPARPSFSPLTSRSGRSVGTISRASSSSDLSDCGAAIWPAQLQFTPEYAGSGLWHSDMSCEITGSQTTSRSSSSCGQRLPVFRDISSKSDESRLELHLISALL